MRIHRICILSILSIGIYQWGMDHTHSHNKQEKTNYQTHTGSETESDTEDEHDAALQDTRERTRSQVSSSLHNELLYSVPAPKSNILRHVYQSYFSPHIVPEKKSSGNYSCPFNACYEKNLAQEKRWRTVDQHINAYHDTRVVYECMVCGIFKGLAASAWKHARSHENTKNNRQLQPHTGVSHHITNQVTLHENARVQEHREKVIAGYPPRWDKDLGQFVCPFQSEGCNKQLSSSRAMLTHINVWHLQSVYYRCSACPKWSYSRNNVYQHIRRQRRGIKRQRHHQNEAQNQRSLQRSNTSSSPLSTQHAR